MTGETDHDRVHERERLVARETAERLEREVEKTAVRLERVVEQTASRTESAVKTALDAVAATAAVHSQAHTKEHLAHERIHAVENEQVAKAEQARRSEAEALARNLTAYKAESNEWRGSLRDQENKYLTKTEAAIQFETLGEKIEANQAAINTLRDTVITTFSAQSGSKQGIVDTGKIAYQVLAAVGVIATIVAVIYAVSR